MESPRGDRTESGATSPKALIIASIEPTVQDHGDGCRSLQMPQRRLSCHQAVATGEVLR